MSLYNFLIYDNIYNDYESVNPFKLIIEIPSDSILMLISRLNCILWSRENDKETQNILLYGLIDQFNPESKKIYFKCLKRTHNMKNTSFLIIFQI